MAMHAQSMPPMDTMPQSYPQAPYNTMPASPHETMGISNPPPTPNPMQSMNMQTMKADAMRAFQTMQADLPATDGMLGQHCFVKTAFISDDVAKMPLNPGMGGTIVFVDKDGDMQIQFDGIPEPHWVFRSNFNKLKIGWQAKQAKDSTVNTMLAHSFGKGTTQTAHNLANSTFIHKSMRGDTQFLMKGETGNAMYDHEGQFTAHLPQQVHGLVGPSIRQPYPAESPEQIAALNQRLKTDVETNKQLKAQLKSMLSDPFRDDVKDIAGRKAGLHDVDWRVPRLMYCKDPRFNHIRQDPQVLQLNPKHYEHIHKSRQQDCYVLEQLLGDEAAARNAAKYDGIEVPEETQGSKKVAFLEVNPHYVRQDGLWDTQLKLKGMDDAMRGDVRTPLPRPVLFPEDYDNFQMGRFVPHNGCPTM